LPNGVESKKIYSIARIESKLFLPELGCSSPEAAVVDRYLGGPPGPQQQTRRTLLLQPNDGAVDLACLRANPPHAAAGVDRSDRQTDRRTPYRYIEPSAYYATSVNNPLAWQKVTAAYRRVYDSRHLRVI